MIKTTEYKKIPATIIHQITGVIDVEEVKRGINEANEIINKVIHRYGRFNLIIDMRGISFTDLAAHKTWKIWSQSRLIEEKVNYTAIVLVDSPHTRAEMELMETETVQFFFDFNEDCNWLNNILSIEKTNCKAQML
ncbi:MAG: hypothetical protein O8C66_03845 [Candidatus Methanoperedens sp.]|nr:hypothetical protein [Candidatus Methanoperedens sp.]MCZ7369619.1 hypothetical protein [Candidatus Methanoperedens sp.]